VQLVLLKILDKEDLLQENGFPIPILCLCHPSFDFWSTDLAIAQSGKRALGILSLL
jgi:hypothetical protein